MKRMKRWCSLLLALCMTVSLAVTAGAAQVLTQDDGDRLELLRATVDGTAVDYWLYTPDGATADMPLIVFLHGGGGTRISAEELTGSGYNNLPYFLASDQVNVDAHVLMPHTTSTSGFDIDTVLALTGQVIADKAIDPERVSLTGHSMGGTSTWEFARVDQGNVFQRYAPLSGMPVLTSDTEADIAAKAAIWKSLSIRTIMGNSGTLETRYRAGTLQVCTTIQKANPAADLRMVTLDGSEHAEVVNAYRYNTPISANQTLTDPATSATDGDGLMDWLSFAALTSDGGEGATEDGSGGGTSGGGAEEAGGEVFVDKTALLADDGAYTITLEGYATGSVVTTSEPVDICLILDVSGSMRQKFDPEYTTPVARPFSAMYQNVSTGRAVYYHLCDDGTCHETAWTQSGSVYTWTCTQCGVSETGAGTATPATQLYIVDTLTDYGDEAKLAALKTAVNTFLEDVAEKNASVEEESRIAIVTFSDSASTQVPLQAVDASTLEGMKRTVDGLTTQNSTDTAAGMEEAVQAMDGSDRQKIYILFTDGVPTRGTGSAFSTDCANDAVRTALSEKEAGAILYTIAVVDGADPADTSSEQINRFLNAVSSNYPAATAYDSLGDGGDQGYYLVAENAGQLIDLYREISNSSVGTSVTLDGTAVLRDVLADGFVLGEHCEVSAQQVPYAGGGSWGEPAGIDCDISVDGGTVSVTGFDYAAHCVADAEDGPRGSKLVVTITGVEATDAAIGTGVVTNRNTSALYTADGVLVEPFPVPATTIGEALYVLDYAKTTGLALEDFLQQQVLHLAADGMHRFDTAALSLFPDYGNVTGTGNALTYTPTTMQWDGYDSFYAFGTSDEPSVTGQGANANGNLWSKISVLPANNVYYGDTFVTSTDTAAAGAAVGIVYTGNWTQASEGENAGTPETGADGDNHGWVAALDGEGTDTDGTAAGADVSGGQQATATFTFTGSGVDLYSRTSPQTGTILVTLTGTTAEGDPVSAVKVIDTVSSSGEYYQVPTCTFGAADGLGCGTYTVTIRVTSAAAAEGRYTYYLDGIRVYNPLSHQEEDADDTIQAAYGEELHAYFEEIQDHLIDQSSGTLTGGAVFIDRVEDEVGTVSAEVGTYQDLGPKNEVYLASGQVIVLGIDYIEGANYYVGLKLLNGADAASVTAGVLQADGSVARQSIDHSGDLYYQVTPVADGDGHYTVTIQNRSEDDALLSITKLKVTNVPSAGTAAQSFLTDLSTENALAVASLAYAAPAVDTGLPTAPEEEPTPEEEPDAPAAEDVPEEEPAGDELPEVEIRNPEPPARPEAPPDRLAQMRALIQKLFGRLRTWFA